MKKKRKYDALLFFYIVTKYYPLFFPFFFFEFKFYISKFNFNSSVQFYSFLTLVNFFFLEIKNVKSLFSEKFIGTFGKF